MLTLIWRGIKPFNLQVHSVPQVNMFSYLSAFIAAAFAVTAVRAHGYVQDVVVDSTHYTGYLPYSDPYTSPTPERIIRRIPGNGVQNPH